MSDLLRECRSFRWGFGWGLSTRIATADDAHKALAVLSMKDGDGDHRDQIVALDRICDAVRRAGLAVAALLSEAAGWSITRDASALTAAHGFGWSAGHSD